MYNLLLAKGYATILKVLWQLVHSVLGEQGLEAH